MSSPSVATVKRLFAVSRNRCAFANCETPLVSESGKVTGKICHIEGKRGPRYNPVQSAEERDSFDNLLLLCALHHDIIDDDVTTYTVDVLRKMKREHESATADGLALSDDAAAAFVGNLAITIESGSVLTNTGQTGGQFAHIITNIVHDGSATVPITSALSQVNRHHADALLELWEQLLMTLDAVFDATVNLAPLEGRARRQAYDMFAAAAFPSLATGSEFSAWETVQNEYLHVMAFPRFGNKAVSAIDDLERRAARARLLIPSEILLKVREIASQMRSAVENARQAKIAVERWRSVMLSVQAIEHRILSIEDRFKVHVQTGGG
jgi:hypothetical protein